MLKKLIFLLWKFMYHNRSLGNSLSTKRTNMLIAELCSPLQWVMLLYRYMSWLVVITVMDVEKRLWEAPNKEFCYMNAVTPFQFQLMHWTNLKHLWSNLLVGVRSWAVQRHGEHNRKNEKEEHANSIFRWRYIESYVLMCKPSCTLPKELSAQLSSLYNWK